MLHAVRIEAAYEPPGAPAAQCRAGRARVCAGLGGRLQALHRRLGGEPLPEQAMAPREVPADPESGRPALVVSLCRFPGSRDLDALVAELAEGLAEASWWRISHHECGHDRGGRCGAWRVVAQSEEDA